MVAANGHQGWKMAAKKPRFKKTSKVQNLVFFLIFLVQFYANHIKFHIFIVITDLCVLLYFTKMH